MLKGLSVSIIIPTLNGLLQSDGVLLSIERQSYLGNIIEVIIVDDASKNPQKKMLYEAIKTRFPRLNIVVLYHQKNTGPAGARNTGIRIAKGDVIFFTDDDCDLPSNWIEEHLKTYESYPFVSSVGGWYRPFKKDVVNSTTETLMEIHYENTFGNLFPFQWDSRIIQGINFPAINTANLSVRKYVFNRVRFDEDFIAPGYEDQFFSESIRRSGYIMYYIPLFVFHHKNLTVKGFFKLCMNRGMGRYVYLKKYGIRKKYSFFTRSLNDSIQKMSLQYFYSREKKMKLLLLDYIRYFLVDSQIMQAYYRYKYFKRMGYYPKTFLRVSEQ